MEIIDLRIRERGQMLDGFPGLGFKAYLSARKDELGSLENLYAPFYVWREPDGLSDFVCGPGFAALSADFGRPSARTWIVWRSETQDDLRDARFAVRSTEAIAPGTDLGRLRKDASAVAVAAATGNVLASVVGFEPTTWTLVRFQLLREAPEKLKPGGQAYRVGHVSLGPGE